MKKSTKTIKKTNGKVLEGKVLNNTNTNTILVEVASTKKHSLYNKRMKRTKKYQVHCTKEIQVGTKVIIGETKKISKNKYFKIIGEVK